MKSLTLLFIIIGLNFSLFSQPPNTVTRNKDGKLYQVYYVVSGDGWYSIAKKFNTTYAELRLANKTGDDKLNIGRELLIPLSKIKSNDPFFEKNYLDSSSNSTNNKPLFHLVESNQTLYSISKMYHVTLDQIKKWNNLTSNDIKKGQKLIVGKSSSPTVEYTDVRNHKLQSSEVVKEESTPVISISREFTIVPVPSEEEEIEGSRCEEPIYINRNYDVFPSNIPGDSVCFDKKSQKETTLESSEVKNEIKQINIDQSNAVELENIDPEKIVFNEDRKEILEEGYGSFLIDKETNQEKYFAYHRTAPNGTIIKVTNVSTAQSVYVRVVGGFSEPQYSKDIIILISGVSAEKLGIKEQKFQIKLQYGIDKEK